MQWAYARRLRRRQNRTHIFLPSHAINLAVVVYITRVLKTCEMTAMQIHKERRAAPTPMNIFDSRHVGYPVLRIRYILSDLQLPSSHTRHRWTLRPCRRSSQEKVLYENARY